jgi:flagellar hook assembly protein FlgD
MAILPPIITSTNKQSSSTSGKSSTTTDAINDIDVSTFLKLMITELQQQDPLNPLDNKDMLDQIAQIRAVSASDKLTDDGQSVNGIVSRIAIDQGAPKLHIENLPAAVPSSAGGNIEAGTYSYRVVWDGGQGQLLGLDFSGDKAITTTGAAGVDRAVQLQNLPITNTPKFVYRTDATGSGPYELVGVISDGSQGTFVDGTADKDRNGTQLTQSFQPVAITSRAYDVSLSNVSTIRPPGL